MFLSAFIPRLAHYTASRRQNHHGEIARPPHFLKQRRLILARAALNCYAYLSLSFGLREPALTCFEWPSYAFGSVQFLYSDALFAIIRYK